MGKVKLRISFLSSCTMGHSIAILDDYQSVALRLADWSKISSSNEITVFTTAIPDDKLLEALSQYDVIVAMRERTKFPRRILEKLPNLRHIATTGMRNRGIDINACRELGIVVSGTLSDANAASGTVEQAWALILSLSRRLVLERDDARSGGWQSGIATALKGKQLGLVGWVALIPRMQPDSDICVAASEGWGSKSRPLVLHSELR